MYPIYYISINKIFYQAEHPDFPGSEKSNKAFIDRHLLFVEQLKAQDYVSLASDGKSNEAESLTVNINKVWWGFQKHRAMINPLIVKKHNQKYYVVIGNQRLTCLKALNFSGRVPCRIAKSDDFWDDRIDVLKAHPYVSV